MFPTILHDRTKLEELEFDSCRNPLKSGQCFLRFEVEKEKNIHQVIDLSQSPQIGSMFPTLKEVFIYSNLYKKKAVAIPSNRVNVSYMAWGF